MDCMDKMGMVMGIQGFDIYHHHHHRHQNILVSFFFYRIQINLYFCRFRFLSISKERHTRQNLHHRNLSGDHLHNHLLLWISNLNKDLDQNLYKLYHHLIYIPPDSLFYNDLLYCYHISLKHDNCNQYQDSPFCTC